MSLPKSRSGHIMVGASLAVPSYVSFMKRKIRHPTIADVAREAGVGNSTVSRVINGGSRVNSETLERVQAVIRALDYQPNHAARILKGERAKNIGLIVPSVADQFFASCAEAAQEIARSHGFLLIVTCSNNDPRVEMDSLNTLIQRRVDGLLLAPAASNNELLVRTLSRAAIPVVSFDRPIYNSAVRAVLSANYGGAKEATQHLIAHGYKQILCLGIKGEDSLYTHQRRILGYRHAMQAAKLAPNVDLSITTYESAEITIKKHLDGANPPDAIFSLKHRATIYAYKALQKLHIKIPDKVALIGFDDFELASTLQPPITVVEQQSERMARTAAELLFEDLMQKQRAKSKTTKAGSRSDIIQLETRLIVRISCGCRPPHSAEML